MDEDFSKQATSVFRSTAVDAPHRELMRNCVYNTEYRKYVYCTLADYDKLNSKHKKKFAIIKTRLHNKLKTMTEQSKDARFFASKKYMPPLNKNILKHAKNICESILSPKYLKSIRSSKGAFRIYRRFEYRFLETEIKDILPVRTDTFRKKKSNSDPWLFDQIFLIPDNISDAAANFWLPGSAISN